MTEYTTTIDDPIFTVNTDDPDPSIDDVQPDNGGYDDYGFSGYDYSGYSGGYSGYGGGYGGYVGENSENLGIGPADFDNNDINLDWRNRDDDWVNPHSTGRMIDVLTDDNDDLGPPKWDDDASRQDAIDEDELSDALNKALKKWDKAATDV